MVTDNVNESDALRTLELVADLATAWLSDRAHAITAEALPGLITTLHAAIIALRNPGAGGATLEADAPPVPAVSVRKSLASREHLVSLIDGKPYTSLKRHLTAHGLTPEAYRARYNLPASYPMVAPVYSEKRRAIAHKLGLGRKAKEAVATTPEPTPAPIPARKRKMKSVVSTPDPTPEKPRRARAGKAAC